MTTTHDISPQHFANALRKKGINPEGSRGYYSKIVDGIKHIVRVPTPVFERGRKAIIDWLYNNL